MFDFVVVGLAVVEDLGDDEDVHGELDHSAEHELEGLALSERNSTSMMK